MELKESEIRSSTIRDETHYVLKLLDAERDAAKIRKEEDIRFRDKWTKQITALEAEIARLHEKYDLQLLVKRNEELQARVEKLEEIERVAKGFLRKIVEARNKTGHKCHYSTLAVEGLNQLHDYYCPAPPEGKL